MILVERLRSGWTLLKFIRVTLGVLILSSSIQSGHTIGMIAGGLFTLISLLTDGVCFGAAGCGTPAPRKIDTQNLENIEYEELGHK